MHIILFGPPGVGKGTQSKKLISHYQLKHIAPGNLLRTQIQQQTPLGKKVAQYINVGKLAPAQLVIDIVMQQLTNTTLQQGFLLDGFPRTVMQATQLDTQLARRRQKIDAVIILEVPTEELIKRIQRRATLEGRVDDQEPDKIKTRMHTYQVHTLPVLDYYRSQHSLIRVCGVGDEQQVFTRIVRALTQVKFTT